MDNEHTKLEDQSVEEILRNMDKELCELSMRLSQDAEFSADVDLILAQAEDHIQEARHKIEEL